MGDQSKNMSTGRNPETPRWKQEAARVRSQQDGFLDHLSRQWWMYAGPMLIGFYIAIEDLNQGASPIPGLVVGLIFALPLIAHIRITRRSRHQPKPTTTEGDR